MLSHLNSIFFDFSSIFTSNFDPLNRQNHCFSPGKQGFFKKSLFEVGIDF